MRAAALALALAPVALAACGEVDAENEPFVGTVLYEHPMGAFRLRMLQPPWLPPLELEGETIFIVPPQDATVTTDPAIVLGEALHSLQIGPQLSASPAAAADAVAAGLPAPTTTGTAPGSVSGSVQGSVQVQGSVMLRRRELETASGAPYVELSWQEGDAIYRREAFVAASGGATFHLRFRARNPNADDPMIAQMISSFEPGP